MKQFGFAAFLFVLFSSAPPAFASQPSPFRALIYKGPGSCAEGCSESAAQMAQSMGMETRFVSPREIRPEIFKGVQLWIQPGGNAIEVSKALKPAQLETIRNFVSNGGGYVGFCAGAFLADSTVDDHGKVRGLGMLPVPSKDLDVDSRRYGIMLPVLWRGAGVRQVYFYGGASFEARPGAKMEVLAYYSNREIAALHSMFGRGNVVVAGFHPEAPDSWKTLTGMPDPDGLDWDLAAQMIKHAVPFRLNRH